MDRQPELETSRLTLRPFAMHDASDVQALAGEREIAATTATIPHPYPNGAAEEWIESHATRYLERDSVHFAICLKGSERLIGAIGLTLHPQNDCAELGYWIGKPYWNQGYCTEAAQVVIGYGFEALRLNRISAVHFLSNPASGRVMDKVGMRMEGIRRQAVKRWGVYYDVAGYAILREEHSLPDA